MDRRGNDVPPEQPERDPGSEPIGSGLTRKSGEDRKSRDGDTGKRGGSGEPPPPASTSAHREIVAWWLLSRMIVFGVAAFVHVTEWPHRFGGGWLGVLTGWDGNWYRLIAERGYFTLPGSRSGCSGGTSLPRRST